MSAICHVMSVLKPPISDSCYFLEACGRCGEGVFFLILSV